MGRRAILLEIVEKMLQSRIQRTSKCKVSVFSEQKFGRGGSSIFKASFHRNLGSLKNVMIVLSPSSSSSVPCCNEEFSLSFFSLYQPRLQDVRCENTQQSNSQLNGDGKDSVPNCISPLADLQQKSFSCDVRESTDARSTKKNSDLHCYKKLSESSWEKDNRQNFNMYAEVSILNV